MTPNSHAVVLPPRASETLHTLWQAMLTRGGRELPRDQLRLAAQLVADEARISGLSPEQLLIAVKASWASHTGGRRLDERLRGQPLLSAAVAACIAAYFEPGGAGGPRPLGPAVSDPAHREGPAR